MRQMSRDRREHERGEGGEGGGTMTAEELLDTSPFRGDLEEDLAAGPERRPPSGLTLGLAAAVILVFGVLVGIQAHKTFGSGAGQAAAALPGGGQRLAGGYGGDQGLGYGGRRPPGGYGQGQAQQGGPAADLTAGTVKLVDGEKIYVQTSDGATVTVTTSSDTKIQVTKEGKVSDLKPGTTIVVQGEKGEDGSVAATSVNQGGGLGARGTR